MATRTVADINTMEPESGDPLDILWTPIGYISEILKVPLYPWQEIVHTWFEDTRGPDASNPDRPAVKGALCTPNGAGKSTNIVAPLAIWWLSVHKNGKVIITTKDAKQLVNQVWEALSRFESMFPHWTFLKSERKILNGTGGFLVGFTTDDPGRAEGWHPYDMEGMDGPLLMIVDEAKSVKEDIFQAIDRCTYQALLYTSSPGVKRGTFYKAMTDIKLGFKTMMVGYKDCPHKPKSKNEDIIAKYGIDHPFTRSTIFGEFMDEDDENRFACPSSALTLCRDNPPAFRPGNQVFWCDFAAGGDENTLYRRKGNRVTKLGAWREKNEMAACGRFVQLFKTHDAKPSEIYGDNGGLGHTMITLLEEMGWPIHRVDNGSSSSDPAYFNRGTQIWMEGAKKVKRMDVIFDDEDEIADAQMTTRQIKYRLDGRIQLIDKETMRKDGLPSPDRADGIFGVLSVEDVMENIMFDQTGLRKLEVMAQSSQPERGTLEVSGQSISYSTSSYSPWLEIYERPTYGCSYVAVLNPMDRSVPGTSHEFFIFRDAYKDDRSNEFKPIRLAARIKAPCHIDNIPLAEQVERICQWYGYPTVIPIIKDRVDIVDSIRAQGVTVYVQKDFESVRRGKQSNVVRFGWEVSESTRNLWITSLAEVIRENKIVIEDMRVVTELIQINNDNIDRMRAAEAVGVAVFNISLASAHMPPTNSKMVNDYFGGAKSGWADASKASKRGHS